MSIGDKQCYKHMDVGVWLKRYPKTSLIRTEMSVEYLKRIIIQSACGNGWLERTN
jgi:hypothetical protein